jgi:hypothetical protein
VAALNSETPKDEKAEVRKPFIALDSFDSSAFCPDYPRVVF